LKLVLDTNIYCDYAEGLGETVDVIATHGEYIYIPSIVIGELTFGFMRGKRQQVADRKSIEN
jgi:predicted nucleic acid-binding protein